MKTKITKIIGRQIIDSRGNPTVEADVYLNEKFFSVLFLLNVPAIIEYSPFVKSSSCCKFKHTYR